MSNSAYDIWLGDVASLEGFRVRSFTRESAPLVASKFSTGAAGETDLDMLKAASIKDLAGGMFQRAWGDEQKVARAAGFFNRYDDNLYPTPPTVAITGLPSSSYSFLAKAENELYTFVAFGYQSAGNIENRLYITDRASVISGTPTIVEITSLPAGIKSSTTGVSALISGLCLHKGYLYVCGATTDAAKGTNFANYRYDISAGTWQNIGSFGVTMFTMRGLLFMVGYNSDILSVTNETIAGSATYTVLDYVGLTNTLNGVATDAVEYNGAGWISKADGLYRFDGVKAVKILNTKCEYLTPFNGALYYISGNWLLRFDGASITKIQYFGTAELVKGLSATPDFLLVQTMIVTTNSYAESDKPGLVTSGFAAVRTYTYDAASFFLIAENTITYNSSLSSQVTPAYVGGCILVYSHNSANQAWGLKTSGIFTTTPITSASLLEITLSEFDDNFPNVFKSLEGLEAVYSNMISGDSIVAKYQYHDGKVWSSWITAGTITSSTSNLIELTGSTNKLFKRVRVLLQATLATGSTLSLKGGSIRYTLQPRMRWRWQAHLMASGNGTYQDRNGNSISTDANALTNIVVKASKQKTPTFLLTPDYGIVKTGISAVALTFIIKGRPPIYTDPYSEYQLCAVRNSNSVWEVLRVSTVTYDSGNDETTITVLERGYYGVTAATISANAEFHIAHRVYVTRLLRDSPDLSDLTYKEQSTTGESQLEREFVLEFIEV